MSSGPLGREEKKEKELQVLCKAFGYLWYSSFFREGIIAILSLIEATCQGHPSREACLHLNASHYLEKSYLYAAACLRSNAILKVWLEGHKEGAH